MKKSEAMNILRKAIQCPSCNGEGIGLEESLGIYECPDCGGDGHRLYGMEGTCLYMIIKEAFNNKE